MYFHRHIFCHLSIMLCACYLVACSNSQGSSDATDGGSDADSDGDVDSDADGDGDGDGDGDTDADTDPFTDTGVSSDKGCEDTCDGICVGETCCPFDQVCGSLCCGAKQVCFANACVVPGEICHSAADCEEGEYCESALGEEGDEGNEETDAGVGDGDGVCLADAPEAGRCLELPKTCDEGQGVTEDCLEKCEYYPETGPLDAAVEWYWGTNAKVLREKIDIWATPAVGRAYDTNCDGVIDDLDPPMIVFVAGTTEGTWCGNNSHVCHDEVLRAIDGASGKELWTLKKASPESVGFAGMSVALADIDDDGVLDIITATGEGYVVMVDAKGHVRRTSDLPIQGASSSQFGWGGGFAVADMDGDSYPEIAFGNHLFETKDDKITRKWIGAGRSGGGMPNKALSTFVDLDGAKNGHLELLAGPTAYKFDGSILWDNTKVPEGFPGVGDFDNSGPPEVVVVAKGNVYMLKAQTGDILMGPLALGGGGDGGPPTVADFDGDGFVEIGVAQKNYYYVVKPNYKTNQLEILWQTRNHDFSSSVTGSTVFDFEGDGAAEVVYNDECFLWVYDGKTGEVKFANPTTSFTGTEASLVADIDGDGKAELLMIANGVDPSKKGWQCDIAPWNTLVEPADEWDPDNPPHPAWVPPAGQVAHRGLWAFGSKSNSWVGTRTLWNQHTYHVTNICDHRDDACEPPNTYGSIPIGEKNNWEVSWLNNFRQNVQDSGMFNAPDVTVSLRVECWPDLILVATVQNRGQAILPAGVEIGFFVETPTSKLLGTMKTGGQIFPGQSVELRHNVDPGAGALATDYFKVRVMTDPNNIFFHECREENNESEQVTCPGSGML